ncbi:unnamed protein product [Phytophthora fragariaefolia]|uniref:Unnamed protein product n=1 Tax=Phytophthora fragariaefolia TaxID=1490495 RepID=A0A9W7D484_9STRA|nr:unnamed protein product [Phytophthora fragariaefolia]
MKTRNEKTSPMQTIAKSQRSTRPTRRSSRLVAASANNNEIDQPGTSENDEVRHSEGDNNESECEENLPTNGDTPSQIAASMATMVVALQQLTTMAANPQPPTHTRAATQSNDEEGRGVRPDLTTRTEEVRRPGERRRRMGRSTRRWRSPSPGDSNSSISNSKSEESSSEESEESSPNVSDENDDDDGGNSDERYDSSDESESTARVIEDPDAVAAPPEDVEEAEAACAEVSEDSKAAGEGGIVNSNSFQERDEGRIHCRTGHEIRAKPADVRSILVIPLHVLAGLVDLKKQQRPGRPSVDLEACSAAWQAASAAANRSGPSQSAPPSPPTTSAPVSSPLVSGIAMSVDGDTLSFASTISRSVSPFSPIPRPLASPMSSVASISSLPDIPVASDGAASSSETSVPREITGDAGADADDAASETSDVAGGEFSTAHPPLALRSTADIEVENASNELVLGLASLDTGEVLPHNIMILWPMREGLFSSN